MRRAGVSRSLAVGLLALSLLASVASAGATSAADRLDRIAAALRRSPVFVDPDVSYLLDARDRAALGKQIGAAGIPMYLVGVPLLSEDESGGEADYFLYLLHQRLGRPGVYLVADQRGDLDWTSYQVPRKASLDFDTAHGDTSLPRCLHDVIDAFARAPSAAPSTPQTPAAPEPDGRHQRPSAGRLAGEFAKVFFPVLIVSALVLWPLWLIGRLVFGGVRRAVRGDSRTLGRRRLRRRAAAELTRLAEALGHASDDRGRGRATADYDAARLLYDEKSDPGSLFGVIVLALDGQDALRADTATPDPRCMVDPLHGPAPGTVRVWLPGLPDRRLPLCEACRQAAKEERRPLMLIIDGEKRPYYQAPGLWERIRGRHASLPEDVLEYLGVE
ncbi:hypothetical protein GCM10023196_011310 [Actinoallomurus vinaceus]|uniref:TPM domain-containing protein n=2 Tax=Actinoallomurus vinaceus TaxID=1080074 RepID=A0ABP8U1T9_9ACTN